MKIILTTLSDATNDLSMPCHEQRAGAATANDKFYDRNVVSFTLRTLKLWYSEEQDHRLYSRAQFYTTWSEIQNEEPCSAATRRGPER